MGFRRARRGRHGQTRRRFAQPAADCHGGGGRRRAFKFTVTSPYMLARTLLDHHYRFDRLTMALGEVLATKLRPAHSMHPGRQANIGNPADSARGRVGEPRAR